MTLHPIVDLGHRGGATVDLVARGVQSLDRRGPFAGRAAGGGEVAGVLAVDALDQQGFGARQRCGVTGRDVEGAVHRVAAGQVHRVGRCRLQNLLGVPQFGVNCLGQHGLNAIVRLVAAVLLAARLEHGQLCLGPLVEPLVIDETVRAGADLGGDLRSDVGVRRLDLLDFLLVGAVLRLQQQIERLDHRGFADLVGAGHHDHAVFGKVGLAVVDTAIVLQDQAVQLHAAPRPCWPCSVSRSNKASAACASPAASSSPPRATPTNSSTAAAANPPMPRSLNSPSAGITARSLWLSHTRSEANSREYLSRQAPKPARAVTVNEPIKASRNTVRSLSGIRSRFRSRSAMSRLLSTCRLRVLNRQRPTLAASPLTACCGSVSSMSTISTWPGSASTSS